MDSLKIGDVVKVQGMDDDGTNLNGIGLVLSGVPEKRELKGEISYEFRASDPFPQIIILYKAGNKKRLFHFSKDEIDNCLKNSSRIRTTIDKFNKMNFRMNGGRKFEVKINKKHIQYKVSGQWGTDSISKIGNVII
jgi:hypothetical protein